MRKGSPSFVHCDGIVRPRAGIESFLMSERLVSLERGRENGVLTAIERHFSPLSIVTPMGVIVKSLERIRGGNGCELWRNCPEIALHFDPEQSVRCWPFLTTISGLRGGVLMAFFPEGSEECRGQQFTRRTSLVVPFKRAIKKRASSFFSDIG